MTTNVSTLWKRGAHFSSIAWDLVVLWKTIKLFPNHFGKFKYNTNYVLDHRYCYLLNCLLQRSLDKPKISWNISRHCMLTSSYGYFVTAVNSDIPLDSTYIYNIFRILFSSHRFYFLNGWEHTVLGRCALVFLWL